MHARALFFTALILLVLLPGWYWATGDSPNPGPMPTRVSLSIHSDDQGEQWAQSFDVPTAREIEFTIDQNGTPDSLTLEFIDALPGPEVKVQWRTETSLSVQDEGAHLDLLNWRHGQSQWQNAARHGDRAFRFRPLEKTDAPFPPSTMEEVRSEVAQHGDPERWLSVLRHAHTLDERPLYIGVSKISLRIQVKRNGSWVTWQQLNMALPLGC